MRHYDQIIMVVSQMASCHHNDMTLSNHTLSYFPSYLPSQRFIAPSFWNGRRTFPSLYDTFDMNPSSCSHNLFPFSNSFPDWNGRLCWIPHGSILLWSNPRTDISFDRKLWHTCLRCGWAWSTKVRIVTSFFIEISTCGNGMCGSVADAVLRVGKN